MPCFEPVLTIAAGRSLLDHVRSESLDPVDHAPQVDVDDASPAGRIAEQVAASAGPGVVHQHGDLAERVIDRGLQAPDVVEAADVDREGSHRIRLRRGGADFRGAGLERVAAQVRHAHFHAKRGEFGRSRQANAAGRSGDDRDPVRGQCGMIGQLKFSDVGSRPRYHHAEGASRKCSPLMRLGCRPSRAREVGVGGR